MRREVADLREFVGAVLEEKRVREADVTGGAKVPFGSSKHVRDLQRRIRDLEAWRAKQKKGSENRANYSRLISKLKGELAAAKRAVARAKLKEVRAAQVELNPASSECRSCHH